MRIFQGKTTKEFRKFSPPICSGGLLSSRLSINKCAQRPFLPNGTRMALRTFNLDGRLEKLSCYNCFLQMTI